MNNKLSSLHRLYILKSFFSFSTRYSFSVSPPFEKAVETEGRRRRMKPGGERKISLEEYVDFVVSHRAIDFTISYLNQILHMHGFRKLHKSNKRTVGGAVDALDLIDPSRSTLKQTGISSSSASLTLDEVITDIEALKWQECCLTSLQVINSEEVTRSVTKPKSKSNKRKKPNMKKLMSLSDAICEFENENSTIVTVPRKMRNKTMKKKRNVNVSEL